MNGMLLGLGLALVDVLLLAADESLVAFDNLALATDGAGLRICRPSPRECAWTETKPSCSVMPSMRWSCLDDMPFLLAAIKCEASTHL